MTTSTIFSAQFFFVCSKLKAVKAKILSGRPPIKIKNQHLPFKAHINVYINRWPFLYFIYYNLIIPLLPPSQQFAQPFQLQFRIHFHSIFTYLISDSLQAALQCSTSPRSADRMRWWSHTKIRGAIRSRLDLWLKKTLNLYLTF